MSDAVNAYASLVVDGLEKRFGEFVALHDMTFVVESGEVVGLVGPNGCGKSTTLRCVAGLLQPSAGTISVLGGAAGSPAARASLAYIPDQPRGFDYLTVNEFLELIGSLYEADTSYRTRAEALLEAFALADKRKNLLRSLSNGTRRIISMVAGIATRAPLLVVDEAAAALDPEAVIVLREALRIAAASGSAVLLATQDLSFAEKTCSRFCLLHGGRLIASGGLDALKQEFAAGAGPTDLEAIFVASMGGRVTSQGLLDAFSAR